MEKLVLNFSGYSDIEKNDIVIERINSESGNMEKVDVTNMTSKEIIKGIKKGEFYINFMETYANTLDGDCSLELETAPEDDF